MLGRRLGTHSLECTRMSSQKEPDQSAPSFNYLRREDGSWNLLVIFGSALAAVFLVYIF